MTPRTIITKLQYKANVRDTLNSSTTGSLHQSAHGSMPSLGHFEKAGGGVEVPFRPREGRPPLPIGHEQARMRAPRATGDLSPGRRAHPPGWAPPRGWCFTGSLENAEDHMKHVRGQVTKPMNLDKVPDLVHPSSTSGCRP